MRYLVLSLLFLGLCSQAQAAVTVNEQVMQKGQYTKPGCKPDAKDPDYNECICDADVRFPQIAGMASVTTQERLNDWFKKQAAKTVCEGNPAINPTKSDSQSEQSHTSLSVHYEVTFSSPHVLAFKFTDWAYTGGAHGNGSVIGVIVDLDEGTLLDASHIFSTKAADDVNKVIYTTLSAKPEEEVFRDQVEARKGAFIKDGECQGCTLTLMPDGVHVLFQTYEVAPYGAGNTDVLIPAKYVSYEALRKALSEQKQVVVKK